MSKEEAIKYLKNVLKNWPAFVKSHRIFAEAINKVVEDKYER